MQDTQTLISSFVLICAALAALAFGVLSAYVVCRGAFAALRLHARSIAHPAPKPQAAAAS